MTLTHTARKEKAKRLQKYVANKIGKLTGLEVGKDCPIESRQMGETGPDVRLDNTARKMFPYTAECKNSEKWDIRGAIDQAKNNRYPHTDWVVFLASNNVKPVAVLDAEVLFKLLDKIKDLEEPSVVKRLFK